MYYKPITANIWIIHDDIDLPLGSVRIRFGGAAAGHHGVESVIEHLGTDKFWRFRMGIGQPRQGSRVKGQGLRVKAVDDYVLGKFTGAQWGKARELIKRGSQAIGASLEEGLERAMSRFNTR